MSKNHLAVSATAAPMVPDSIWNFLKKLPQKASILGLKCRCNAGESAISLVYSLNGSTFKTSFSTKGGNV